MQAGDKVYLREVNESGWAFAEIDDGAQQGWLPHNICERLVRATTETFAPENSHSGMELLPLTVGTPVVVYSREGRGWDFGARLRPDGTVGATGWFPGWVLRNA